MCFVTSILLLFTEKRAKRAERMEADIPEVTICQLHHRAWTDLSMIGIDGATTPRVETLDDNGMCFHGSNADPSINCAG